MAYRASYRKSVMEDLWAGSSRNYGVFSFIFDVFMVFLTSGIWLIWIFVREMRRR